MPIALINLLQVFKTKKTKKKSEGKVSYSRPISPKSILHMYDSRPCEPNQIIYVTSGHQINKISFAKFLLDLSRILEWWAP